MHDSPPIQVIVQEEYVCTQTLAQLHSIIISVTMYNLQMKCIIIYAGGIQVNYDRVTGGPALYAEQLNS